MNYEFFEIPSVTDGEVIQYVTIFIDENNAKTFPADESNPDYVQFITEYPEASK